MDPFHSDVMLRHAVSIESPSDAVLTSAFKCALLSQVVYSYPRTAPNILSELEDAPTTTRAVCVQTGDQMCIAIAGTNDWADVRTDLNIVQAPWSDVDASLVCKFHAGCLAIVQTVLIPWVSALKPNSLVVTGHSLGGALAQLLALWAASKSIPVECVTFGAPRVGNAASAKLVRHLAFRLINVMALNDPIPMLPLLGYWRWGQDVAPGMNPGPQTIIVILDRDQFSDRLCPKSMYVSPAFTWRIELLDAHQHPIAHYIDALTV